MEQSLQTISVWKDFHLKTFLLYKNAEDPSPLELKPNDFIYWDGRDSGAKIVDVIGCLEEEGPRGFTYLPWREEGRWATPVFSLRGNARVIICYPTGGIHYGQHVPLHTIIKGDLPKEVTV